MKDGLHGQLNQRYENCGLLAASIEQLLQASLEEEEEEEDWLAAAEKRFNDLMPPKRKIKARHPCSASSSSLPSHFVAFTIIFAIPACALSSQIPMIASSKPNGQLTSTYEHSVTLPVLSFWQEQYLHL